MAHIVFPSTQFYTTEIDAVNRMERNLRAPFSLMDLRDRMEWKISGFSDHLWHSVAYRIHTQLSDVSERRRDQYEQMKAQLNNFA